MENIVDFITSSAWENETVKNKILGYRPTIPSLVPVPIIAPDAELEESVCFAQTIKEMTKMHAEFKSIYKDSNEFVDDLSADYVDSCESLEESD